MLYRHNVVAAGTHGLRVSERARQDAGRDVPVDSEQRERLFEREHRLSDTNETHEGATFPVSAAPSTVVVTVEGTGFDYRWPGGEPTALRCNGENRPEPRCTSG